MKAGIGALYATKGTFIALVCDEIAFVRLHVVHLS